MNPAFLDNMSWEMAEVYGAVTDQILINLAHYFPYYDARKFPRSSITYQADMLAQMGQVSMETMQIIRRNLKGVDRYLNAALEQVIVDSVQAVNPALYDAVKKGIFRPAAMPVVAPNQYRAFNLYYTQAANKLNLVNTVMLESTQQAYQATVADIVNRVQVTQTALDIGAGETITGVSTWNQATQHAINRMKANGITGIIDHGGHHWSAESYVAMDIRTTVFNTGRAAVWETNQSFGNDLYQVSYHNGARPLCYPWQNKVISSTDNARTVVDLDGNEIQVIAQSDTSYGEAAGLFGVNCKHYPNPFIPGVSVIRGEPQDEEANAKTYAESQEQRRLERRVREEKRDLLMEKARGAPQEVIDAQRERVRQASADVQDFCDSTGRARHRDREGVYTKREFPAADTYDVAAFERKQKELIYKYYKDGGAQQAYTFGQMQPNVTTQQTASTTVPNYDTIRKKALEDYDAKIDEIERKRMDLLYNGSSDSRKADKLYEELEKLETRKRIVENGGWTIDQATAQRNVQFTVNPGTSSEIQLAGADIYTMPDGKQFVFKHAMNKAHQKLTPDDLVETYYQVPKTLRDKTQNTISVVDRYNPRDSYWKKTYKNFTQSYMTGGEQITIYRWDYEHDKDYMTFSLEHEMGHKLDKVSGVGGIFSESQEWVTAMAEDKVVSGLDSMREYGTNSRSEDFADSIGYYFTKNAEFTAKMPNRAKLIEGLLGLGVTNR